MGLLSRRFTQIKKEEDKIRSVDLVAEINKLRMLEGNTTELKHKSFLTKVKKYNTNIKKINGQNISLVKYKDSKGESRPTYLLTKHEAMIFASSESDIIKYQVIQYMDGLESDFNVALASIEHTKDTHDNIKLLIDTVGLSDRSYVGINREINDLVAKKFDTDTLKKDDMDTEQLEFRAEVEEFYIDTITANEKHGGTKTLAKANFGL